MFKKILQKLFPWLFSRKTYLAFGVEESVNRWPLEKARYPLMASYIHRDFLRMHRKLRVLDIGCRDGNMLSYCDRNGTETDFYGLDIVPEGLKKAIERGFRSVSQHDIRNRPFPYPDQFFDAVILSHILEHLERPGDVLKEVGRILKPGGLLIVGIPVGPAPAIWWRRHVMPRLNRRKRVEEALKRFGHVSFFTLRELKRLLKEYGFETEEARGDYLIRARGFILENWKGWFDLNQFFGKLFPGLLGHVTLRSRYRP